MRPKRDDRAGPRLLGALTLALLGATLAAPAHAVNYVRSVEYVEVTLTGTTIGSTNLTKGQIPANCVPFASAAVAGTDARFGRVFTDVYFQASPSRVTVQRDNATGSVSVGVFVVEFDPSYVNVHQGTFVNAQAAAQPTTSVIPLVNLAKAALVFYYRYDTQTVPYSQVTTAGWFGTTTQLNWQRSDASVGTVNGHYYVFEARNAEFSVQATSFALGASATANSAPALTTPIDPDKTMVIASYRTDYPDDDNEDGQFRVALTGDARVTAYRTWGGGSGSNNTPDIRVFVVQFSGAVRVQRGTLAYADADTQMTATIEPVRTATALAWNVVATGPGAIEHRAFSSPDSDGGFQRLKLASATSVQGDRDGICGTPGECQGVGSFEVVDFDPIGRMRVKSGAYAGNNTSDRPIFVGFQPDVVFVKREDATNTVVRTSTMGLDQTKSLNDNGVAPYLGGIKSFTADGFTLGTHVDVNGTGANTTYYWIAFKAAPGELKVGSYTGDNASGRVIPNVGFQPNFVITLPEGSGPVSGVPWLRSSTMVGNEVFTADVTGLVTERIQGMEPDGFRVGNQASVNGGGAIIHYIAWNQVAGRTAVGTYTGTGIDPTNHDEVGFMPEWVLIKRNDNTRPWIHKPASMFPSADYQAGLGPYPVVNGFSDIKTLRPLGFQVGVSQRVNVNPIVYHWIAFGPHAGGVNYRSIGPAVNYVTGTVQATPGSTQVLGTGTGWKTANRGRGDRMQITGSSLGDYTVASVVSDTVLYLTVPYEGTVGPGKSFSLQRKFVRPSDWVGCVDGPLQAACGALEAGATLVSTTSLVTDDRVEVGILYNDDGMDGDSLPEPFVFPVSNQPIVWLTGVATDATRNITLTVDSGNRHTGVGWNGAGATPHVVFDYSGGTDSPIRVAADFVTLEWIDLRAGNQPGFSVGGGSGAITASNGSVQSTIVLRNNIAHAVDMAFDIGSISIVLDIYDNIAYGCNRFMRMEADQATDPALIRVLNNSVWGCTEGFHVGPNAKGRVLFRNNIAAGSAGSDFLLLGTISPQSSHNLSEDATAGVVGASPGGGGWPSVALGPCPLCVSFTSTGVGSENLHLLSTSRAIDQAANLASVFGWDIDGGVRTGGWDIGADEFGVTTAVRLQSFVAVPGDGSVLLEWRTASELDNLGFHVYRSQSESGPWTRLNASLIPGLGSSAVGQAYSFRDAGLTNGTRYFYRLEDVDASSKTTSHGPVSAVPTVGAWGGAPGSDPPGSSPSGKKKSTASATCPDWVLRAYASSVGADSATASLRCSRHGDPEAVSLDVVSRSARGATLELRTGGFYALHTQPGAGEPSGTVRVFIPGFDFPQDEKAAALPIRRALADAIVGRRVQLGGVRALELVRFKGLVPSALGKAEMQVGRDGTVRASRRGLRPSAKHFPKGELATLLPSVFQGETKSAVVEIAPLRFDAQRLQLVLAKRVLVRLLFTGRETGESGTGSVGRAPGSRKPVAGELLARLHTTSRGLYAASFEQLFPQRRRGFAASQLRLERQGEAVAFHVEPISDSFGPGSRLYFFADKTPISTDFSAEVAYALVRATDGLRMPIVSAAATGVAAQSPSTGFASFETDRFYQPGLLDAADPWLWEAVSSGTTRAKTFSLAGTDATSAATAELDVFLQGASESGNAVDHHVSVSVNGVPVGDAQFAGKKPYRMSLSLPASLLREGANDLSLTNVADTGVSSYVFLNRFAFAHPQLSSLAGGRFDGEWPETGSVSLSAPGAVSGPILVVDATGAGGTSGGTGLPAWLTGHETTAGAVRFRAEAGRRYWVASDAALFSPRIAAPQPSELKSAVNQADYLLIAPRAFLAAAEPLLQRRQDQGLATRAVAFEEIVSEFGHGQGSAEAIKAFLAYAFHSWARPSPRYVLLLGDSSYDPRNFIGSSQPSPLPALWAKTSYLWTVSDPQLVAVNGEDLLPDMAIGRLPATTLTQAEALVSKLLSWEDSGQGLSGAAALVADNPDLAGDFEADVEDIRASYLAPRATRVLKLAELGGAMRPAILEALNSGLSYLSYVGHGGAAVWASENVWNSWDAPSLQAQSQQPLLVTMNCLNGYFVAPAFESLSESLLKAEGRGAIASFSPSGLSLDGPAHQYHRALMAALTSGEHERLGDAVLAAQKSYAASGLMPELLGIYHLLGDPATRIRRQP